MDRAEDRYDALTDEVAALYEAGRQADALTLMDATAAELGDQLTPWAAELAHLRACLLGSLGDSEAAFGVLLRASEAGGWWAESILTEDDDLAGLRSLPGFDALVATSRARRTPGVTPPLVRLPVPRAARRTGGGRAARCRSNGGTRDAGLGERARARISARVRRVVAADVAEVPHLA